jgi:predicted oxidoreductase (fatty acid repression mutant protein)
MKKQIMLLGALAIALAFVTMGCKDVTDLISGGGDITYTAEQEGGSSSLTDSTGIKLRFSAAVSSLSSGEIHVDNDAGTVTKGELTGSGAIWHVALDSVTKQGNVAVSISKSGIESEVKTVAVYKAATDKAALTTALSAANTAKSGVSVDTSAANVPVGSKWVTQAELTALADAITAAEEVKNNAAATQTAVDSAVTALNGAVSTFNAAKKDGTNTSIVAADKAALNTALSAANTAKTGVSVDTSAGNVLVGTKWVTPAELTALTDAITAAEGVNTKAGTTQTEVDNAVTALNGAVSTFNAAKKDGTKTGAEDADRQAADAFTSAYSAALSLTAETVVIANKDAVNAAVTAYNGLSAAVKVLLTSEKTKLDSLVTKIGQLETAAAEAAANQTAATGFTSAYSAALSLTAETVAIANKDAVQAALTAYNSLTQAVKVLLTADTGTKLQALLDKIGQLETAANQTAATGFTSAYSAALSLTAETVVIANKDAVQAALTAYNGLTDAVKVLLTSEKTKLDSLVTKIGQLETAAAEAAANQTAATGFTSAYSAALSLTAETVTAANKGSVQAALTAYDSLTDAVKALLVSEKAKLDSLLAKITTATITVGFNYGEITITGSDGSNVISKSGAYGPASLVLSATGYTNVVWYVDGSTSGISGSPVTINAADYSAQQHSIIFTGTANGHRYSSQSIPFAVLP